MALIRRVIKGTPLTFAEGDANLVYLEGLATNTGSFAVTTDSNSFSGSQIIAGNLNITGSTSLTGSLNVSGSITTTGTLTVRTLVVEFISSSITYSSGSNKFGDQTSDTQTFTGSVGITGSLSSIGAFSITNNISASNSTQLSFGSNLFLQTSGSSATNAFEIRAYGGSTYINGGYAFLQPTQPGYNNNITFNQPNSSITIVNGNSDSGVTLSRPGINTGESRLTSGPNYNSSLSFITFYTLGNERVRIDGSGSLLVGTTTSNGYATIINQTNIANFPSGALYVNGSSSFTGSLNTSGSLSSIGAFSITNNISASNSTQLSFGSNLFLQTSGSSATNAFEIRPYGNTDSLSSYKFTQPTLTAGYQQSITFDKNNASITISNGNADGGFTLSRPNGNGFESRLTSGNSGTSIPGIMTFYTSGSERMRIDGSGSLLIGTNTSNGYLTNINGANTTTYPSGALYVTGSSSFTGSVNISGSLNINNNINITSGSINIATGSISIAGANILNTALAYSIIFG